MLDRVDEIELADLRSGRDEYSNLKLAAGPRKPSKSPPYSPNLRSRRQQFGGY